MKIKEAMRCTNLTERAIRLYIKEELIFPGQRNGIFDLSTEDVGRLKWIALLRRSDFSIPQIRRLLSETDSAKAIVEEKIIELQADVENKQELLATLRSFAESENDGLVELMQCIGDLPSGGSEPDFGRFDEIPPGEREAMTRQAWSDVERTEKRMRWLRWVVPICAAGLLAIMLLLVDQSNRLSDEYHPSQYELKGLQQKLQEILREMDGQSNYTEGSEYAP